MSDEKFDQIVLIAVLAIALLGGLAFVLKMWLEYYA